MKRKRKTMTVRYCAYCKQESFFDENVIKKRGGRRCNLCINKNINEHSKMNKSLYRMQETMKKFTDVHLKIDKIGFHKILRIFQNRCVITGNELDQRYSSLKFRPNLINRFAGKPVNSLRDIVLVSSAVTMRVNRQKGMKLSDKTRCIIHALESDDVKERVRAAHERLDRIEAAEKKLRDEEQGSESPTSPLSVN